MNIPTGPTQTTLSVENAATGGPRESNVFDWIEEDLMRGLRSGQSATARALQGQNRENRGASGAMGTPVQPEIELFPPFKADPGREGGIQRVGTFQRQGEVMARLARAGEAEAARRQSRWWSSRNEGIEPVSRGDAEEVGLRDSQITGERLGEAGRWVPTSNREAALIEQALARAQNIRTGSGDSPRRADAPLKRRGGKVRAEEIDRVMAELEAQGVADPREDPRFREMEEAARFVRSIPRREGYEGDPSLIEGPSASGKSWGGINPYGPLGLVVSDAAGRIATRGPQAAQLLNVYPGESTGRVRNLDKDATALWDREEDPTLGRLVQEARNQARTPVITGIGLDDLARSGRFRRATPSEMQALAPERENAPNTLRGFVVQAGTQPMSAGQLVRYLNESENRPELLVSRDGRLIPVDPSAAEAGFNRILSVTLDPANPELVAAPSGRFTKETASRLPELYLKKPDGTIARLAMGVQTGDSPDLLVREWAPVYESDAETQVERAIRNSLGQPDVTRVNTKLYRVGRPTNQNNEAIKEALRDLLPGGGVATQLSPRTGIRPLLQGQQRGDYGILMRSGGQTRPLQPQEVEAELFGLVQRAVDPSVPGIGVDPVTNGIITPGVMRRSGDGAIVGNSAEGIPQFMIQQKDGSIVPIPVSVRPGPNPEPLVQLPQGARVVGPTFLNPSVKTRMQGVGYDAEQDLYPILRDLTEAAFSEGAPVASTQQVTRELMAGLIRGGMNRDGSYRAPMAPVEAANVVARVIAERTTSPTARQDYGNALKNAVIEFTGGESRLGPEVTAPPATYTGLAEVLDFARGLNQRERTGRVVPAGDIRERLRTRVRMNGEADDGALNVLDELSDPVRQALQDEMAARELAGYARGRGIDVDVNDLDSDAYLAEGLGRGSEDGIPGESPRGSGGIEISAPTLEELVAASAYRPLAASSLAGRRSMSEYGPIDNALRRQAELLAAAAIQSGGATTRPMIVEQLRNTPEGQQRRRIRAEQRIAGMTPEALRAAAERMAEPEVRPGFIREWTNYGNGWNER